MVAWIYGLFFGSYLYISKIFCYSIVRSKEFSRTWSIVQAVQVTLYAQPPTERDLSLTCKSNIRHEDFRTSLCSVTLALS